MNIRSSIHDLLGDAPLEAQRADQDRTPDDSEAAPDELGSGAPTTGGPMESNRMDREDAGVSSVSNEGGLSTADVASATATPVPEAPPANDMQATDERSIPASQPDQPERVPVANSQQQTLGGATQPATHDGQSSSSDGQGASNGSGQPAALFPETDALGFRDRWTDVQAAFVDEPRRAVKQADGLVAEVIQRLAQSFADERSSLEHQWDRGEDVSTEDLRQALRRYRSFFDRLLSL